MKELRFYKPRKTNDGAASKLNCVTKSKTKGDKSYSELMMFWVAAKQKPSTGENAEFYWDAKDGNSVNMKMGELDAGDILAVLHGVKKEVGSGKGIYHQNSKGSSSFQFAQYNDGYSIRLAFQDANKKVTEVKHLLSAAEAEILRVFLMEFLRKRFA